MQAIRVHHFGDLDALVTEDVPRPSPGDGEVLLRVKAAGVGPWDARIKSGRSVLPQPLPLTLGSDVSGLVERIGAGVSQFGVGDAVFGATNARFTGGYAEYAVASASMLAKMPPQNGVHRGGFRASRGMHRVADGLRVRRGGRDEASSRPWRGGKRRRLRRAAGEAGRP